MCAVYAACAAYAACAQKRFYRVGDLFAGQIIRFQVKVTVRASVGQSPLLFRQPAWCPIGPSLAHNNGWQVDIQIDEHIGARELDPQLGYKRMFLGASFDIESTRAQVVHQCAFAGGTRPNHHDLQMVSVIVIHLFALECE
jgi:hypothetical protein